jgi:hypothetical protein
MRVASGLYPPVVSHIIDVSDGNLPREGEMFVVLSLRSVSNAAAHFGTHFGIFVSEFTCDSNGMFRGIIRLEPVKCLCVRVANRYPLNSTSIIWVDNSLSGEHCNKWLLSMY